MEDSSELTGIQHIAPMVIEPTTEPDELQMPDVQKSSEASATDAIASNSVAQPGMVYQMINMNINGVVKNLMVPVQQELNPQVTVPTTNNPNRVNALKSGNGVSLLNQISSASFKKAVDLQQKTATSTVLVRTINSTASKMANTNLSTGIFLQKPTQIITGTGNTSKIVRIVNPVTTAQSSVNMSRTNAGSSVIILPDPSYQKGVGMNSILKPTINNPIVNNTMLSMGLGVGNAASPSITSTTPISVIKSSSPSSITLTPSLQKEKNPVSSSGIMYTTDKHITGISIDNSGFAPILTLTPQTHKRLLKESKFGRQVFVQFSQYKSSRGKSCAVVFSQQDSMLKSYLIELDSESGIIAQLTSKQNGDLLESQSISTTSQSTSVLKGLNTLSTTSTQASQIKPLKINSVFSLNSKNNAAYPLLTNTLANNVPHQVQNATSKFKSILNEVVKPKDVSDSFMDAEGASDNLEVSEGVSDNLMDSEDENYKVLAEWNPEEDTLDESDDDYDPIFNRKIHDPDVRPMYGLSTTNLSKSHTSKEGKGIVDAVQKKVSASKEEKKQDGKRKHSPFNSCKYYGCIGCSISFKGPAKPKKKNKPLTERKRKKLFKIYKKTFPMLKECKVVLHRVESPEKLDCMSNLKRKQVAKKSTTKPHKSRKANPDLKFYNELPTMLKNEVCSSVSKKQFKLLPKESNVIPATTQESLDTTVPVSSKSKYLMVKTNAGTFLVPTNNEEPAMVLNQMSSTSDGTVTAKVIDTSPQPTVEMHDNKTDRHLKITPSADASPSKVSFGLDKLIQGKPEDGKTVGKLIENIMGKNTESLVKDVSDSVKTDTDDNVDSDSSMKGSDKTESSHDRIKRLKERLKAQQKAMEGAKKVVENSKNVLKTIDLD